MRVSKSFSYTLFYKSYAGGMDARMERNKSKVKNQNQKRSWGKGRSFSRQASVVSIVGGPQPTAVVAITNVTGRHLSTVNRQLLPPANFSAVNCQPSIFYSSSNAWC